MAISPSDLKGASALYKRWRATAWIDGVPMTLTELPTRVMSALRPRNTAAVRHTDALPGGGRAAMVDLTLDGTKTIRFFTGKTDQRSAQSSTWSRQSNLIDLLNLERAVPADITWSSTSFTDAVTDLLEAAGLSAADIDSIADPGSTYALGPVYAITITPRETIGAVLAELMAFGGTSLYVTPTGRVRVIDSPGIPASTSAWVYARGADLDAGELGITDAGFSIEGDEQVISTFTATGPKRPDGAIPDGTYTASGVSGTVDSRQYRFAQSDPVCLAIAQREVSRRARERVSLWVSAPLNPLLLPGATVRYRDAALGFTSDTPALVLEVATTAEAEMRMTLSLGASLVDGYGSSIAPPNVDFSMTVDQQLIGIAGAPAQRYQVQCRDQSGDRAGYEITARAWTATGDVTPTSSSEAEPVFSFASLEGAEITLAVTSESGESASLSRAPRALETQVLSRTVSVAAGSAWKVLYGTAGWRTYSPGGTCTAVPSFNDRGPLMAGFSGGQIYRSWDALATTPALVATLSGSVGCVFVNEGNPAQMLAGHGSTLSRSGDYGGHWAEVATFDDPVTDAQSSPANPNEIRVCSGDSEWITFDGGATWTAIIEWGAAFDGSATAEALATAPWGHGVVFSGVASAAEAVLFEELHAVDWSGVAGGDQPSGGLNAITALRAEQGFVVGDGAVTDLIRDGNLDAIVLYAASGTAGRLYKLLWDGAQFVASLLTANDATGAGKLINQAAAYPIDTVGATSIGYGPLATPRSPIDLLVVTYGADPGGVWVQRGGGWELSNTGLPAGWNWVRVAVSPLAPQTDWLIVGFHPTAGLARGDGVVRSDDQPIVWRTTDGGLTWSGVDVADPEGIGAINLSLTNRPSLGYTTGGQMFLFANYGSSFSTSPVMARGTGDVLASNPIVASVTSHGAHNAIAGPDGDIIVAYRQSGDDKWGYLKPGDTIVNYVDTQPTGGGVIARLTIPGVVVIGNDTFTGWNSYKYDVNGPSISPSGGGGAIAAANGNVYVAGDRTGIYQITGMPATPAGSVIAAVGAKVWAIAADPAQAAIAAIAASTVTVTASAITIHYSVDAGTTWTSMPGPDGGDLHVNAIAVIGKAASS